MTNDRIVIKDKGHHTLHAGHNLMMVLAHGRETPGVHKMSILPLAMLHVSYANGDWAVARFDGRTELVRWILNRVKYGHGRYVGVHV